METIISTIMPLRMDIETIITLRLECVYNGYVNENGQKSWLIMVHHGESLEECG